MRTSFVLLIAVQLAVTLPAQQPARPAPAKATSAPAAAKATVPNDIFSGTVSAAAVDSVTVVRKVPARADEYRVFVIDKDTRIEGKLKVNGRVTVRYAADSGGAVRALRIIVRTDVKTTPAAPGRSQTGSVR